MQEHDHLVEQVGEIEKDKKQGAYFRPIDNHKTSNVYYSLYSYSAYDVIFFSQEHHTHSL